MGFIDAGKRILLSVSLGIRESYEDWQALGRDVIARGLGAPMLIVAGGARGWSRRSSDGGLTHQTNAIHFNELDRPRLGRARYEGTERR